MLIVLMRCSANIFAMIRAGLNCTTSDGVTLKEFDGYTNHFDAIVTDPPYVLKAEKYTDDERDLCNCSHDEFLKRIKLNFKGATT